MEQQMTTLPRLAALLAVAALAGCANVTSDTYCVAHRHGTATVTDAGIQVDEGRCTGWLFGPTVGQRAEFERAHGKGSSK
jgi:hypothetical protein